MLFLKEITQNEDKLMADTIRSILKSYHLDKPGTAYYDKNLDHLSTFYNKDNKGKYFVLFDDDKFIGGCGFSEFIGFNKCAEVQKLYIKDGFRNLGYGKYLLINVEKIAKDFGYSSLYLETCTPLRNAVGLYEHLGYKLIDKPKSVVHSAMDLFYFKNI